MALSQPPVRQPFFDKNGNMSRIWWLWFAELYKQIPTPGTSTDDLAILQAFTDIGGNEAQQDIQDLQQILAAIPEAQNTSFRQAIADIQAQLNQPVRNVRIPDVLPQTEPHGQSIDSIKNLRNALDALSIDTPNVRPGVLAPLNYGLKIAVSSASPANPSINDLWVQT